MAARELTTPVFRLDYWHSDKPYEPLPGEPPLKWIEDHVPWLETHKNTTYNYLASLVKKILNCPQSEQVNTLVDKFRSYCDFQFHEERAPFQKYSTLSSKEYHNLSTQNYSLERLTDKVRSLFRRLATEREKRILLWEVNTQLDREIKKKMNAIEVACAHRDFRKLVGAINDSPFDLILNQQEEAALKDRQNIVRALDEKNLKELKALCTESWINFREISEELNRAFEQAGDGENGTEIRKYLWQIASEQIRDNVFKKVFKHAIPTEEGEDEIDKAESFKQNVEKWLHAFQEYDLEALQTLYTRAPFECEILQKENPSLFINLFCRAPSSAEGLKCRQWLWTVARELLKGYTWIAWQRLPHSLEEMDLQLWLLEVARDEISANNIQSCFELMNGQPEALAMCRRLWAVRGVFIDAKTINRTFETAPSSAEGLRLRTWLFLLNPKAISDKTLILSAFCCVEHSEEGRLTEQWLWDRIHERRGEDPFSARYRALNTIPDPLSLKKWLWRIGKDCFETNNLFTVFRDTPYTEEGLAIKKWIYQIQSKEFKLSPFRYAFRHAPISEWGLQTQQWLWSISKESCEQKVGEVFRYAARREDGHIWEPRWALATCQWLWEVAKEKISEDEVKRALLTADLNEDPSMKEWLSSLSIDSPTQASRG